MDLTPTAFSAMSLLHTAMQLSLRIRRIIYSALFLSLLGHTTTATIHVHADIQETVNGICLHSRILYVPDLQHRRYCDLHAGEVVHESICAASRYQSIHGILGDQVSYHVVANVAARLGHVVMQYFCAEVAAVRTLLHAILVCLGRCYARFREEGEGTPHQSRPQTRLLHAQ